MNKPEALVMHQTGKTVRPVLLFTAVLVSNFIWCVFATAQVFDERFDDWPLETSIGGKVCFATELDDLTALKTQLTRREVNGRVVVLLDDETRRQEVRGVFDHDDVVYRKDSDLLSTQPSKLLSDVFADGNVVCWLRAEAFNKEEREHLTQNRQVLQAFVKSGGTLICIGPMADLAGRFAIRPTGSSIEVGLSLIADTVIASTATPNSQLSEELVRHSRTVGLRVTPQALVVLNGRTVRVAGQGKATFVLPKSEFHAAHSQTVCAQTSKRQDPNAYLVDLTQWRRKSIERTLPPFPAETPGVPVVPNGTLLIVGGGVTPDGLMQRFVRLAGGKQAARLVYIPCTESDQVPKAPRTVESWKKMGVQHATWVHTKDRQKANSDDKFLTPLMDATGLWLGGGRQWNLADSYYGTEAHRLMKQVLHRGGVVGGSSAGASIQARYLARATPIQNLEIMAPGYERGGLGFLSGVAIDQHFSQRKRQSDMSQLVNRYPQLLGVGVDEGTALIVQQSRANIVGDGRVFFYDKNSKMNDDNSDYLSLPAGSAYDLAERKILRDTREIPDEPDSKEK